MRVILRSFLLSFLVLGTITGPFAFSKPASTDSSVKSPVIRSIEIQGNRKIEKDAIRSRVKSKPGTPRSIEAIRDDIRAVFSMGFFDSIEVDEQDAAGGVVLNFIVKEKPTIGTVEYKGLEAFEKDELKDQIEVKQYEVLDMHKLNVSVEKLNAKYEEKGYYLADVRYDLKVDEAKNEANITFVIEENDKIQVKTINIIGNNLIPDDELKKVMQTKEGDPFSWVTGSGSYREAVFERDVATLGYYYGTMGYVRARFGKPEVTVSPDKKWIYLTFSVEEGDKYNVGKVDFSGELLFTREELSSDLALITGEAFNTDTLRRETLKYTEKYSDLGYAFANVVPQPIIHDDTKMVDVTFEIDRGERVYIGKVIVTGNTRTKDKVVRRELLIHEGELFNGTKKRLSRENVVRLGFFDNVEFQQETSKTQSNVVDIEIKVKERSTGQLVIGAGYASGNIGFTAQAQLSQNNFMGNGQIASLSAQVLTGRKFYEFNLGFTEPYVNYSNWSLGGDLYQIRRTLYTITGISTFDETKSGFDMKLGHPVLEFTNLYLTYKFENSYVPESSIIDRSIIPKASVNGITSSAAASIVFDKRDDRFDPRNGHYWSLSSEFAGLAGDRHYVRSRANAKFFHNLFWDFVFRANVAGGNISPLSGHQVPINELYIQGGLFSQRGYDFMSIGPRRRISTDTSQLSEAARQGQIAGKEIVIGGNSEVLAQAEIEFPILKEARIRGVVFVDAGNAFNGWFENSSPAIIANLGYGFRWFTPIGPLRFEFGYPMVNGGSPKFYFTIGPPF